MPAANPLATASRGIESPSNGFVTIVAHDTNELTSVVRSIYVGTGGDVALVDTNGVTAIHKNVSAGSYLGPFLVKQVKATGTSAPAADMVGYA